MKTLFLDFDGVLHTQSDSSVKPFGRLPLLEAELSGHHLHIVISSSWRFHFEWSEIKGRLGQLSPLVVGCTGEALMSRHARFEEILQYASDHQITDWRALDDAWMEFPEGEPRLIRCDPRLGLHTQQLEELRRWLA
ncbi:MAG: hypothetical protein EBS90_11275 [Betaproteobacteria bacterium]|nr:hypothetical protein [Betaproteobacteria bacterium]